MEIILAVVIAATVIFFGALISMGNERQRKAIDNLREQAVLWAVQDLRIKREKLAREVRVEDPLGWLNKVASKVCGYDLRLQVVEAFDAPPALVCVSGDAAGKVVFTPLSPSEIRRRSRERRSQLSQFASQNPLFSLPRDASWHEISVLNGGILFDLELSLAWKGLTGQATGQADRLWMFLIS